VANIKSAEKKNRQRIRREARNRDEKSAMRTAVKKLRAAIEAKNGKQAKVLLPPAVQLLDRAGRKGVIKPSAASRAVSRLTVAVNGLGAK
jgi:small subunit ribosomal protein S20